MVQKVLKGSFFKGLKGVIIKGLKIPNEAN